MTSSFSCSLSSDDIVDAAWENSLGVHALIWVSSFRLCLVKLEAHVGTIALVWFQPR
jgi:hypothetical protein